MINFFDALRRYYEKGILDISLRIQEIDEDEDGETFIKVCIHPASVNGETYDFAVTDINDTDSLIENNEQIQQRALTIHSLE